MTKTNQLGITFAHLSSIFGMIQTTTLSEIGQAYNVLVEDLQLLTQPALWGPGIDKNRMRNTLEAMIYGANDRMAIPRIEICAEYIAQWIFSLVSPANQMTACSFFDRPRPAEQLATGEQGSQGEGITGKQLFALVHQCGAHNQRQTQAVLEHVAEQMGRAAANVAEVE